MESESFRPHPKVTVYDNVVERNRSTNLLGSLLSGSFNLSPNNEDDVDRNPDFIPCRVIDGTYWRQCTDPSCKYIKQTFNKMQDRSDIKIGQVDKFSIHMLSLSDMLSVKKDDDSDADVLIYMANLDWKSSWGGDIVIYDNQRVNILCVVPYNPGRVVVFDGKMGYRIGGPTASGPKFMVMATLKFKAEQDVVKCNKNQSEPSAVAKPRVYL
tara:strand:- start:334 stop:969 length:636 start_codon:yes stop_codon:yes gene_type:complete